MSEAKTVSVDADATVEQFFQQTIDNMVLADNDAAMLEFTIEVKGISVDCQVMLILASMNGTKGATYKLMLPHIKESI